MGANTTVEHIGTDPGNAAPDPKDYPTRIDLCDGKYTVIYDLGTGQSECLRYGEPWRQLVGDKMVLAMFDEIVELRQQRDDLLAARLIEEPLRRQIAEITRQRDDLGAENALMKLDIAAKFSDDYLRRILATAKVQS